MRNEKLTEEEIKAYLVFAFCIGVECIFLFFRVVGNYFYSLRRYRNVYNE